MMPAKRPSLKKQKARLGWLADDNPRVTKRPQAVTDAGKSVIERIKKCFARAEHENANEAEARAAFKMASKIMEQHNIQQSDLMEEMTASEREKRGGMSTVNIWPGTKGDQTFDAAKDEGTAFNQGWVSWLIDAMTTFFDCSAYSTEHQKEIEWTFYGIAEHTISAAIAFEAIHNQIQDWAEKYRGVSTRNSYSCGVADGLLWLAEQEQKDTEEKARQYEARALAARIKEDDIRQQAELHRLRHLSREITPESDSTLEGESAMNDTDQPDDTNNTLDDEARANFSEKYDAAEAPVDTGADFDAELQKFIVPNAEPSGDKSGMPSRGDFLDEDDPLPSVEEGEEVTQDEDTPEWKSMRQLSTWREMSRDIEASVLESHNVELINGRKAKRSVKDKDAFKQGQKDSKKIKVKAARIEQDKRGGDGEDMLMTG